MGTFPVKTQLRIDPEPSAKVSNSNFPRQSNLAKDCYSKAASSLYVRHVFGFNLEVVRVVPKGLVII